MFSRLTVWRQYAYPHRALNRFSGWVARWHGGRATTAIIRRFVRRYGVDMSEAAQPDITAYASFNAFFTRSLRPDARPLALAQWVCPVDGAISQLGSIKGSHIFQAKGHHYTTQALLGGDASMAEQYLDGYFATLYLSPRDYHRIHMPCAGRLLRMIHVPGDLFSVNPCTAQYVPGLFARNERLVCEFEGEFGRFVMVLVGAAIVGSMATVWHGIVNTERPQNVREWAYDRERIELAQGQEMGRFLLGSTVVLVWPNKSGHILQFAPHWCATAGVRMGQAMAQYEKIDIQHG